MSGRIDLPTNEGTLALARAISTGAKLGIRGAVPCRTDGSLDVSDVAMSTWGSSDVAGIVDFSQYAVDGVPVIPCTSYLPSMVDMDGTDTGTSIAALDIEFTWMPSDVVEYDSIAVLADMYYEFAPFVRGGNYVIGDTVWYMRSDSVYEYYRCRSAVNNSDYPMNDSEHWELVHPEEVTDLFPTSRNVQYRAIGTRPVLLYVTVAQNPITVSSDIEVDYKVRLYLEGITDSTEVSKHIVFDTLGPEFMGSAQLALLANFAQQLRNIRDVAIAKAVQGD